MKNEEDTVFEVGNKVPEFLSTSVCNDDGTVSHDGTCNACVIIN